MNQPFDRPLDARAELTAFIETGACQLTQDPAAAVALLDLYREQVLREAEAEIAGAIERSRAEHPDSEPMVTRRLGMRAAERVVRWMRETAEETHVVADGSDDPEHIDDCPGCVAFTLTGHIAAAVPAVPATTKDGAQ